MSYLGRSWRSRRSNLRFELVVRFDELKASCAPALVMEDSKPPPVLLSWAATSEPLARRKMYENFMIEDDDDDFSSGCRLYVPSKVE